MATQLSEKKKGKKHWYTVVAPKQFQSTKLGETCAYSVASLHGKTLKANLMTLTNDPKRQSVTLSFRIKEVVNNNCVTDITTYAINNTHIKRLVRKASNKLEDSFLVKTKDGVTYKIKPILLTRHKANKSTLTAIRKKTQETMRQFVASMDSRDIFTQLITHKLQMETKNTLKKIYPIAVCEIKSFTLVLEKPKAI
jgi:ribosomal protein S3AE